MSAQEEGMTAIAQIVRVMTPPQLEAVIIFYPPGKPAEVSTIMALASPAAHLAHPAALARARKAAQAFIAAEPNAPGFHPQS